MFTLFTLFPFQIANEKIESIKVEPMATTDAASNDSNNSLSKQKTEPYTSSSRIKVENDNSAKSPVMVKSEESLTTPYTFHILESSSSTTESTTTSTSTPTPTTTTTAIIKKSSSISKIISEQPSELDSCQNEVDDELEEGELREEEEGGDDNNNNSNNSDNNDNENNNSINNNSNVNGNNDDDGDEDDDNMVIDQD